MSFRKFISVTLVVMVVASLLSCSKERSKTTGWAYNTEKNGGFEKTPYKEQETGPGLVFIEGGTFVMGRTEEDVLKDWDNQPRRVSVSSFYIDETEVANIDYLEYLYWLKRVYGIDFPRVYTRALPDTLVWRAKLAYNEPLSENYLRHPAYFDYPVVGVNWLQARDYCAWRTDRVNEMILVDQGILELDPDQINEENFNTESYLAGQYVGLIKNELKDLDPNNDTRIVRKEDGIMLPKYRLPTEAEWEFAALGLIGNTVYERVVERRLYPWNGHVTRTADKKNYGDFVANFMRGRGDYMGVAGSLNDEHDITGPVYAFWPNDYGLYNMAGNAAEWVADVYRPLTNEDFDDFRPFRGNVFSTKVINNEGSVADKFDYVSYDYQGVADYLNTFSSTIESSGSDADKDLVSQLIAISEQSVVDKNNRDEEAASQKMDDMIDLIYNQEDYVTVGGALLKGISDYISGLPGELKTREVRIEENLRRRNYRIADNIDYLDGDYASKLGYNGTDDKPMYGYGATTMINNRARVYKGGSWQDRAYWLSPGSRRFLEENQATDYIGFRCAMSRTGSQVARQ